MGKMVFFRPGLSAYTNICLLVLISWLAHVAYGLTINMTMGTEITLDLPNGKIGALQEEGLIYARGIKYAEARRFQRSTPVGPWEGIRDCRQPAPICPQFTSGRFDKFAGSFITGRRQDEDCLTVSVAAPAQSKHLPVMVFIHGGAYMSGGGDLDVYNPKELARNGVVVVTITCRLGVLGYLPIPGIAPPNLGLLDQIQALRWVQQNIRAFGGDPKQVTVFGQSSGGDSIFCLMLAEGTTGLFKRAILQSACLGRLHDKNRDEMTIAMGEAAKAALVASSQEVSEVSVADLLKVQMTVLGVANSKWDTLIPIAPVFGEYPLPPLSEVANGFEHVAARIPMLIGYTKDEGEPFHRINPNHTAEYYTKYLFQDPSDALIRDINNRGRKSPMYEFVWHPQSNDGLGACHTIDLPFLLGSVETWKNAPMLGGAEGVAEIQRLGPQLKALWASFAKGANLDSRRFIIDGKFNFP